MIMKFEKLKLNGKGYKMKKLKPSCFQCDNQLICKHYVAVTQITAMIKKREEFMLIPEIVARNCKQYKECK
jgi:hypothetical protein